MLMTLIRWVISALITVKLPAGTWDQIIKWVIDAEQHSMTGLERKFWVEEQVKQYLPGICRWLMDALISLAVGYAGKKGWIHLTTPEIK